MQLHDLWQKIVNNHKQFRKLKIWIHRNTRWNENFFRSLKFEIFHDHKKFESSTNSLNEIVVRIQFQNQISIEKTKRKIRRIDQKIAKFIHWIRWRTKKISKTNVHQIWTFERKNCRKIEINFNHCKNDEKTNKKKFENESFKNFDQRNISKRWNRKKNRANQKKKTKIFRSFDENGRQICNEKFNNSKKKNYTWKNDYEFRIRKNCNCIYFENITIFRWKNIRNIASCTRIFSKIIIERTWKKRVENTSRIVRFVKKQKHTTFKNKNCYFRFRYSKKNEQICSWIS